jgi:O-antigen biosynthesis protein WbqP
MYRKYIKRIIDFILSLVAIVIFSPFLLLIVILIKLDSEGPVLFKQKRIGMHKTHFYMLKFRTMRIDSPKDVPTHLLENPDQWITRMGKILRKTSLDELPQLFNIIKGEMSIIGPRPALWNQYDLIAERDKYGANDVRPGLTGWAQVNGRDELPIEVKARYDGEYVQKMSFMFDLKCLLKTVVSVIKGEGIVEGGANNKKTIDKKSK